MHAKRSRIDGVHTVAAPAVTSSTAKKYPAGKPCNLFGLFEEFEYIPSKYHLVDEIRSKERAESNALRTQVSMNTRKNISILLIPVGICNILHETYRCCSLFSKVLEDTPP